MYISRSSQVRAGHATHKMGQFGALHTLLMNSLPAMHISDCIIPVFRESRAKEP